MATLTYGHLAPAAGPGFAPGVGSGVEPGPGTVLTAGPDEKESADSSDALDGLESGWVLHYSSAGHPPLLVRERDGTVHVLDGAGGIPLGITPAHPRATSTVHIPAGSILLAYTDGLIERRDEILTVGLQRLAETVAAAPHDAVALCQYLLDELTDTSPTPASTAKTATTATDTITTNMTSKNSTSVPAVSQRRTVTHDDVALLALRL